MTPLPAPQSWGHPVAETLDEIRKLALQLFGTTKAVDFWLDRPNPELHGATPMSLVRCGKGEVVKDFLDGSLDGGHG